MSRTPGRRPPGSLRRSRRSRPDRSRSSAPASWLHFSVTCRPLTSNPNFRYASAGRALPKTISARQHQHAGRAERVGCRSSLRSGQRAHVALEIARAAPAAHAESRGRSAHRPPAQSAGGVTIQSPCADCASRNTPWLSPSTYGTVGPRLPRKTMTRCPIANCGAPTTMLRKRPSVPPGTRNCTRSPRLSFQIGLRLERHERLDRSASSVHARSTATTRPRAMATRVARELAEVGGHEDGRPRRSR